MASEVNSLGTDLPAIPWDHDHAALRPLFVMLFTATTSLRRGLCAHTFACYTHAYSFTHALGASGACSLHTTYSNTLLNIKGNYSSPWCMDLSEFLNQRNGLWTRQIPPGPVSRPLPGTPRRIRAVIPTFRFPLIWSWHRGDGLLCISPSQDGGLFTWSPPDWIWSVAHLLRRPLQLRQKNADFFQRVFAALSWVKYYSLRYIHYSISMCLKLDLMDTCCGYYRAVFDSLDEGQISFMNVTAEMDRSTHLSSLTDSANVKRTTPPPSQMWGTPVNSAPFETMKANPHVNVSIMNVAYRRCIILFLLHLFLNIKWIW